MKSTFPCCTCSGAGPGGAGPPWRSLCSALFALLLLSAPPPVLAMGMDHPSDRPVQLPDAPASLNDLLNWKGRIHRYQVNEGDIFFFTGNEETFSAFLRVYAGIPEIPVHRVNLHPGELAAKSPWDTGKGKHCDWIVDVVTMKWRYPKTQFAVEIRVWTGSTGLDITRIAFPPGVQVNKAKHSPLEPGAKERKRIDYAPEVPVALPDAPAGLNELLSRQTRVRGYFDGVLGLFTFAGTTASFTTFMADYAGVKGVPVHRVTIHSSHSSANWKFMNEGGKHSDWLVQVNLCRWRYPDTEYAVEMHVWTQDTKLPLESVSFPKAVQVIREPSEGSEKKKTPNRPAALNGG